MNQRYPGTVSKATRWPGSMLGVLLLAAAWCSSPAGASEGPLYRADGPQGTIYLFGTVHFGRNDFYPLSEAVYTALDASSLLLVEVDVDQLAPEDAAKVMAMMVLPAGEQLEQRIGPELWTRTAALARSLDMPPASLQPLQAWTAAIVLGLAPFSQAGLDPTLGVDQHMLSAARERSIEIVELEDVEGQLGVFDALDGPAQRRLLELTLDQLESPQGIAETLSVVDAWRDGDGPAIERVMNETMRDQAPELTAALLDTRNTNMLGRTLASLESSADSGGRGTVMVVVGAAHLPGEAGLVELLRREGFELSKL